MLRTPALCQTAAVAALLFLVPLTRAQAPREAGALYLGFSTGATAYGGEYDGTGGSTAAGNAGAAWLYRDLGVGLGGEVGYQFTRAVGAEAGLYFGRYANLDRADGFNPLTGTTGQLNKGEGVAQLRALLRLTALPRARLTPYALAGGVLALGQGEGAAYGPAGGLGVEYVATPRVAVFVEAQGALLFPDVAVDGFDPDGQGYQLADQVDYDALAHYGVGVRYALRPGGPHLALECPDRLALGEEGTFAARLAAPAGARWDLGDGASTDGVGATHAYAAPGVYEVSFSARVRGRDVAAGCTVSVEAQGAPPVLEACAAAPLRAVAGTPVTFSVATDVSNLRWDFGDGAVASTAGAMHAYATPGLYEAVFTASNAGGTTSCRVAVSVGTEDEVYCEGVQALEPVHFGFEMDVLSMNGREPLVENVRRLKRCPSLCLRLDAFTDGVEDGPELATRRAEAVRDAYVHQGIEPGRIEIRPLGPAPGADDGRDPLPGDRAARRVESVLADCERAER